MGMGYWGWGNIMAGGMWIFTFQIPVDNGTINKERR
jgi:hypothetical protein